MTASQFARTGPETDGFELVRGELTPMPPPAPTRGKVCGKVVYVLKKYLRKIRKGQLSCKDTGLLTQEDPESVRGVDVMVYLEPNWKGKSPPKGYPKQPPDLAVEIRSPKQSWSDVVAKVSE